MAGAHGEGHRVQQAKNQAEKTETSWIWSFLPTRQLCIIGLALLAMFMTALYVAPRPYREHTLIGGTLFVLIGFGLASALLEPLDEVEKRTQSVRNKKSQ
ncbi:unnamed protein product [Polarella glacialis]|uniref:Uncharacterized protein n=1 Tax=Polarella glacialis TaxID=89957 RepID=A0A813DGP4_POLGL|nr:unnamed protein product [Polarella glacialis]